MRGINRGSRDDINHPKSFGLHATVVALTSQVPHQECELVA